MYRGVEGHGQSAEAMGDAQRIGKPFSSFLPYIRTPLLLLKTVFWGNGVRKKEEDIEGINGDGKRLDLG